MLHEPVGFREIEGWNIAAHGEMKREEGGVEEGEAREDEGEIRGAVEAAASEAVNGAAGRRDVTRDYSDTTERRASLQTLDTGHPWTRGARWSASSAWSNTSLCTSWTRASGRNGWATEELDGPRRDLSP